MLTEGEHDMETNTVIHMRKIRQLFEEGKIEEIVRVFVKWKTQHSRGVLSRMEEGEKERILGAVFQFSEKKILKEGWTLEDVGVILHLHADYLMKRAAV